MLDVLISSSSCRERAWLARAASATLHLGLIAAAAFATDSTRPERGETLRDTTIFVPVEPRPGSPRPDRLTLVNRPGVSPVPVLAISTLPGIPEPLPGDVPRLDPGFDPGPGLPMIGGDSGATVISAPIDVRLADEPPSLLEHPVPRYPDLLRVAGIEGAALIEVVLDTTGRPEPSTVRVIRESHALFGLEARAVVLASRYRPARFGGRAVRVRIAVPVSFRLRG